MKTKSLTEVKNKEGRLDCLLHSLAVMGMQKIEVKTNLPGLSNSVMPILEDEIKKAVPSGKVIPKKYQELARLIGTQISKY